MIPIFIGIDAGARRVDTFDLCILLCFSAFAVSNHEVALASNVSDQ